jgi:RNA polymerase sigma-70 factor, ECF subfamily
MAGIARQAAASTGTPRKPSKLRAAGTDFGEMEETGKFPVYRSPGRAITISMTSPADDERNAPPEIPQGGDSRNEPPLSRLFTENWDRLHRMVQMRLDRRMRGRVNPSDVLQEAYLEVVRSMPVYLSNPKIPVFQWLRHITGMKLMALHRKHLGTRVRDAGREVRRGGFSPQTSSVALAARLLGRLTSPSQAAARAELQLRVQDALNNLHPLDREVLSLRHFEQLTNADTARILGISEPAASNRYVRALKRLRPILLNGPGIGGHLSGRAGAGDLDGRP